MTVCQRCGMKLAGHPHETAEDCVRHLAPRYQLAQQSLEHMHGRYRLLEERLERTQIALRVARKDAKHHAALARKEAQYKRDVPQRLEALEAALKTLARKEQPYAA
jgi:hypothetical protein